MADYDFSTALVSIGGTADDTSLLDLLKDYLGIEDEAQDADLTLALNLAGDVVETYLDRVIAKRPVEEYFQHHFGTVELHDFPVDAGVAPVVDLDGTEQTDYRVWLKRDKVANLTRADGDGLLEEAARAGVKTEVKAYPLEWAQQALDDLRAGRVEGSLVLEVQPVS